MNARARFTRMQDSTQADWQLIGAEFMQFAKGLPDRVMAHLKLLEGDYGGFPVDRYDEEDLRRLYFALGTHLGIPVFQNRSGELMRAIRDEGAHVGRTYGETKDESGKTFLSSYARTLTNGGLRFHTDRTDVVGLLCVRQARAGGVSKLASTPAIHNAILAKRPDLLELLFQDYWRSRFGEEG